MSFRNPGYQQTSLYFLNGGRVGGYCPSPHYLFDANDYLWICYLLEQCQPFQLSFLPANQLVFDTRSWATTFAGLTADPESGSRRQSWESRNTDEGKECRQRSAIKSNFNKTGFELTVFSYYLWNFPNLEMTQKGVWTQWKFLFSVKKCIVLKSFI
jgi:hypothetical protein